MPLIKHIAFLFILFLSTMVPSIVSGNNSLNTEDVHRGRISMTEWPASTTISRHEHARAIKVAKKQQREEKFIARLYKAVHTKWQKKVPGSISDPVDKWLWIWAISWSLGIILTIIAGGAIAGTAIGIIWLAAFVVGSVALILWLVKKYGQ